jgi:hypothetical protein
LCNDPKWLRLRSAPARAHLTSSTSEGILTKAKT